ncbi:MAG: carboxymuconolactone decarboxylase family protein [Candidatus Nomurabacteria bacterium]|nr:MAG: carboxymuconolactone decarboxylase family protein [Candidatus Nomurabacteria bacterium]
MDRRRIRSRGLRDIGLINWIICRIAARAVGAPEMHLFAMLALHKRLFWAWLPFSGMLLGGGRIPRQDTELVILRVAHLCKCEYELQHHRRIARKYGLDSEFQDRVFVYPDCDGLTHRHRAMIKAVDEMVLTRTISDNTWAGLAFYFDEKQLIEFSLLITQYEALAATISALQIRLDFARD